MKKLSKLKWWNASSEVGETADMFAFKCWLSLKTIDADVERFRLFSDLGRFSLAFTYSYTNDETINKYREKAWLDCCTSPCHLHVPFKVKTGSWFHKFEIGTEVI